MIYEKSCGAVIYRKENGKILYLIEHMKLGHYSICKGHVEGNETEKETCLREIKEETDLAPTVDTDFREEIEYSPYKDCIKKVIFFVAEVKESKTIPQPEEVKKIYWLPIDEAIDILTFESDKNTVKKANEYILAKLTSLTSN